MHNAIAQQILLRINIVEIGQEFFRGTQLFLSNPAILFQLETNKIKEEGKVLFSGGKRKKGRFDLQSVPPEAINIINFSTLNVNNFQVPQNVFKRS